MILRAVATAIFVFVFVFVSAESATALLREPDKTIMIPMRDGSNLPADLYYPSGKIKNLPCILMRSPAGRKAVPWRKYTKLTEDGFLVVIQDTRSAGDPDGKIFPYLDDGWGEKKDGYDTVEWLGQSAMTNGNIGTLGFSALGISQQMLAPTDPPSLKCQYIGVAAGSIYHHAAYPGGQLLKNQVEGWLKLYAKDPSVYSFLCTQSAYNDFWKNFDTIDAAHKISAPAIHYGGWYDTFIQGSLDSFVSRQTKGKKGAFGKQKLIIGPWTHYWPENIKLGDFEVPLKAREMPKEFAPQRWFDHYLKGTINKVEELPPVTYYLMGPFDGSPSSGNVWRIASEWPVPSVIVPFYLDDNKGLTNELPAFPEKTYSYEYNPENPVPTLGGRNLFVESGPKDQRSLESRDDVITFTGPALTEEIEIIGRIFARLFFSSDTKPADAVVRFCDVYPDGKSILIADGIFHAPVQSDESTGISEISVDLWSTAIVIAKGHRLRISVSGSNYPRYEKSVIEKNSSPGKNTIYTGKAYPSSLLLPIVPPKS